MIIKLFMKIKWRWYLLALLAQVALAPSGTFGTSDTGTLAPVVLTPPLWLMWPMKIQLFIKSKWCWYLLAPLTQVALAALAPVVLAPLALMAPVASVTYENETRHKNKWR